MLDYSLVQTDHIKECTTKFGFKILQLLFQPFPLVHMQMHIRDLLCDAWKSLSLTPCVELLPNLVGILYFKSTREPCKAFTGDITAA